MSSLSRIAIIGAGIAGLACARRLTDAGHPATLFDKGRGPGGRMSSRRLGDQAIDLGAQHFSARDAEFTAAVEGWRDAGVIAPWPGCLYDVGEQGWLRVADRTMRYVGSPRMSALPRHLAQGLDVRTETRIVGLARPAGDWQLIDTQGHRHGPFERVVVTAPGPQAEALLAEHSQALGQACQGVEMRPCWVAWAHFEAPLQLPNIATDWPAARFPSGPLRLAIRQATKPGRRQQEELLTLTAFEDWSEANLEQPADDVAQTLLSTFIDALPSGTDIPRLVGGGAHRWRYATARRRLASYDGYLEPGGLALAGDGCRGGRVEDAWLSGHRLAGRLLDASAIDDAQG